MITMPRGTAHTIMFKPVFFLFIALEALAACSLAAAAERKLQANAAGIAAAVPDEKQKRRDELRAALRAQGDEADIRPARHASPRERAALREQLRMQGTPANSQP